MLYVKSFSGTGWMAGDTPKKGKDCQWKSLAHLAYSTQYAHLAH